MPPLFESSLPFPVRRGKVRDVYELTPDTLLIVASDRISAFDVIMPTPIPDKGRILTQLSNFWFGFFAQEFPGFQHHLLETDVRKFPASLQVYAGQIEGRSVIVRKTQVLPVECVVRGYITGSGWKDYQQSGTVSGIALPPGLKQCDRLPTPLFTPSTKAEAGHDMPISFDQAAAIVGEALMTKARDLSLALYTRAAVYARTRGIILADTKFEFGIHASLDHGQTPILIDEALTPDSSRFWPAAQYSPGRDQPSFDKQYLRNYLETLRWNKTPPGPQLPEEVITHTRSRYVEAAEKITGTAFS
jgi:phosphoribosylaminoimidazole-succinocarboxamide synthase